MKSYVRCSSCNPARLYASGHVYPCLTYSDFKNTNDDLHPTDYPIGELKLHNSGAIERYMFHFQAFYVHGFWQYPVLPFFVQLLLTRVASNHHIRFVCCGMMARGRRQYPIFSQKLRIPCASILHLISTSIGRPEPLPSCVHSLLSYARATKPCTIRVLFTDHQSYPTQ